MKTALLVLISMLLVSGCAANYDIIATSAVCVNGSSGVIVSTERLQQYDIVYVLTAAHVITKVVPILVDEEPLPDLKKLFGDDVFPTSSTPIPYKPLPRSLPKLLGTSNKKIIYKEIIENVIVLRFYSSYKGMSKRSILTVGNLIYYNKRRDVALLKTMIPKNLVKPVVFANKEVDVGDELISCSAPSGSLPLFTSGICGGRNEKNEVANLPGTKVFTGGVCFGSSGGAVYNKNGNFVGLIMALKGSTIPIWHWGLFLELSSQDIILMKKGNRKVTK